MLEAEGCNESPSKLVWVGVYGRAFGIKVQQFFCKLHQPVVRVLGCLADRGPVVKSALCDDLWHTCYGICCGPSYAFVFLNILAAVPVDDRNQWVTQLCPTIRLGRLATCLPGESLWCDSGCPPLCLFAPIRLLFLRFLKQSRLLLFEDMHFDTNLVAHERGRNRRFYLPCG
jgi:hypothetical protein